MPQLLSQQTLLNTTNNNNATTTMGNNGQYTCELGTSSKQPMSHKSNVITATSSQDTAAITDNESALTHINTTTTTTTTTSASIINNDHRIMPTHTPDSSTMVVATPTSASSRSITLPQVQCLVRTRLPTVSGECHVYLYRNDVDDKEHMAFVFGGYATGWSRSLERPHSEHETAMDRTIRGAAPVAPSTSNPNAVTDPLVRIHSECFTGETLGSVRCDCGEQLAEAMRTMDRQGHGIVVYLRQEGRGIGLLEKLKAYNLQDLGHDTVTANILLAHPADGRTYGAAEAILRDLGCSTCQLLTNNPDKIEQLQQSGLLKVTRRIPMIPERWRKVMLDKQENTTGNGELMKEDTNTTTASLSSSSSSSGVVTPVVSSYIPNEMDGYLRTKIERMQHLLDLPTTVVEALTTTMQKESTLVSIN
ncbi:GTP cyclohydrolase II-domain-containing protein [Syncephalis plumigaleata]|nr:GTP cyclohydrolase II-domain-containing protein [Syncephalis plumigaleata]